MERVGALDIGTVSVRAGVADIVDGLAMSMAKESRICDLGRGVDETGRLDPEAIAAVVKAVKDFRAFFEVKDCHAVSCLLTSAARDAENVEDLLRPLRELGYEPQVVDGDVEGVLAFRGVAQFYPEGRAMVADLGGGSTEVVSGAVDQSAPGEGVGVDWVHSYDLGARRLTDRFLYRNDPPTAQEVLDCRAYARTTVESFLPWIGEDVARPDRLIVTGGTATTLVAMKLKLEPYDSAVVQGSVLTLDDVDAACELLGSLTAAERKDVVGVQPKRASVILGGALLLGELMRATGFLEVTVSEFDGLTGSCLAVWGATHGHAGPIGFMPNVVDPLA